MVQLLSSIVKTARPKQALKNLAIFAALIFSGNLFVPEKFITIFWATLIFTILTSSVYIFNDIIDLPLDKLHPVKKRRPIAKGDLPLPVALFLAIVGVFLTLYLAHLHSGWFFLTLLAYLTLQLLYSLWLKKAVIADILAIAGGFILRVYAGALILGVHLSVWFLLCVISLSLFLAAGKRRAELAVLAGAPPRTRKSLSLYPPELLDAYLAMFANASWLSYALFTFFFPPPPIRTRLVFLSHLPLTLSGINKWLMITIPVVIFGIMRYLKIIYTGTWAEAPATTLLKDRPLLATFLVWSLMVIAVLYGVN